MTRPINCRYLINKLANRLTDFLKAELDISTTSVRFMLNDIQEMQLHHVTTLIDVEGSMKVKVLISYEIALFAEIFARYTANLLIADEEKEEAMADSAGDIINIVVGNILTEIDNGQKKIIISPPSIINTLKQLSFKQKEKFFQANLDTELGQLDVYLVSSTIGEDNE